ncbi:MAG: hypothetical protein NUV80_03015, partial [Candidatus Berkelbacteria bacterium]|nr:hypothetical protein [Candidatus Berkelbacteria bacterium]
MADIKENTTYGSNNAPETVAPKINYSSMIGEMMAKRGFWKPGGEEAAYKEASISSLKPEFAGKPTGSQLLPLAPGIDKTAPIALPSDYSGFMPPVKIKGTQLDWTTPVNPVIRNVPGPVPGQIIQDKGQPGIPKSKLGYDKELRDAILDGRPSWMYQIDHIMPRALGGADTIANKELLSIPQHQKKTLAQSVPYTLFSNGDITLGQARTMAMQWKDKDVSIIDAQSDKNGLLPIDIARSAAKKWDEVKKPTLREIIGEIPGAAKNFGKGWLPDPAREFGKGLVSGYTLGFVPYEQGEDQQWDSMVAGISGNVIGGLLAFETGGFLVGGALRGAGLVGAGAKAVKSTGSVMLGRAGVTGKVSAVLQKDAAKAVADAGLGVAEEAAVVGKVSKNAKKAITSLNGADPGKVSYMRRMLSKPVAQAALKGGGGFVLFGEAQRLVQHKFNPDIISGKAEATSQKHPFESILGDMLVGTVAGIMPPNIRGAVASGFLPATISLMEDSDDITGALTNGLLFAGLHMAGAKVKKDALKQYMVQYENLALQSSYHSLRYYVGNELPATKPGEVPDITKLKPGDISNVLNKALEVLNIRKFIGRNPDGTMAKDGMSDGTYARERKMLKFSAEMLIRQKLTPEMRAQADLDFMLSVTQNAKE